MKTTTTTKYHKPFIQVQQTNFETKRNEANRAVIVWLLEFLVEILCILFCDVRSWKGSFAQRVCVWVKKRADGQWFDCETLMVCVHTHTHITHTNNKNKMEKRRKKKHHHSFNACQLKIKVNLKYDGSALKMFHGVQAPIAHTTPTTTTTTISCIHLLVCVWIHNTCMAYFIGGPLAHSQTHKKFFAVVNFWSQESCDYIFVYIPFNIHLCCCCCCCSCNNLQLHFAKRYIVSLAEDMCVGCVCVCIYVSVDRFTACEMNVSTKTIAGILWAQMKPNKICRFNFKLRYFRILGF